MYILRFTFIAAILFVFALCSSVEAARHIIIIFDVSSSMYRLNGSTGIDTKMESKDIRRVNDYLTDILFTDPSLSSRGGDDTHYKKCDAVYAGKPLYQSGDIITYAEYATKRYMKINRKQVRRDEFQRKLPDPTNLRRSFYGKVSYLLHAKVEVYDELYREADGETYWIFVTDGDVDQSAESGPNIDVVYNQLAGIEDKYEEPMIVGILVNKHVKIEVRRIQKRISDAVFIANRTASKEPVAEIQLSKVDTGQFISEPLIIDTKFDDKTKYKLNSVNVETVDKFNKPLQIVKDDNGFGVLKVQPVSLHGNMPPYEFQILLPANSEIAAPGNKLKLEVNYNYNGKEKIYSIPPTRAVIKDIFVSDLDNSIQQVEKVKLRFTEDAYLATLVVRSENPDKTPFRIRNIHCYILNKDNQKLCDASVKTTPLKLDEPFQVMVSKVKNLDLHGNKLVLNIDYSYEGTTESETIKFDYDRSGDSSGFLIMILFILGCSVLTLLVFAAIRVFKKLFGREKIEYQIMLGEVEQEGMQPDDLHFFTLKDGETLSFGVGTTDEAYFNLESPAVLRCKHGEFQICKDYDDENGRIVMSGQTFTLTRDEGDVIHIYFGIEDDEQQSQSESDYIIDEDDDYLFGN